jgi:hypothetical protein
VLEVLAGHIHFIEFGVVEFVQVAAMLIERLSLATIIQTALVHVTPILQSEDVVLEPWHVFHEVLLNGSLP